MKLPCFLQPRVLKHAVLAAVSPRFTTKFPKEPYEPSERFRGRPRYHEDGCIACGACASVCPTGAIDMESKACDAFREDEEGPDRWCRYARMGLVPPAICPTSFECFRCEVDQRFQSSQPLHPVLHQKLKNQKERETPKRRGGTK